MAKYRKISVQIWNDAKFRAFEDDGKLAFFFLLTHPHMTPLGAIRANIPGLAYELGWLPERLSGSLSPAFQEGMLKHDERVGLLWFPKFVRHNKPESPNVLRSWAGGFDDLPECGMKAEIYQATKGFAEAFGEAFAKAFREAFGHPLPNQEQEQEQEQDIKEVCPATSKNDVTGPAPGKSNSRKHSPISEGPVFIHLPANSGEKFAVSEKQVRDWTDLYGNVDVLRELRAMYAWLDARPNGQRKTVGGMKRFIVAWLKREQDNGGRRSRPSARGMSPVSPAGSFQGDLGFFADAMAAGEVGKEM